MTEFFTLHFNFHQRGFGRINIVVFRKCVFPRLVHRNNVKGVLTAAD